MQMNNYIHPMSDNLIIITIINAHDNEVQLQRNNESNNNISVKHCLNQISFEPRTYNLGKQFHIC